MQPLQRDAQVAVGGCKSRIQLNRAAVGGGGVLQPPLVAQHIAKIAMGRRKFGVDLYRLLKSFDGFFESPQVAEDVGQIRVSHRQAGVERDGARQGGGGFA